MGLLGESWEIGVLWGREIPKMSTCCPTEMRRVRALVEVDGKEREMEFLTNNLQWSAASVGRLILTRRFPDLFLKAARCEAAVHILDLVE
jgi:hypothetical protein